MDESHKDERLPVYEIGYLIAGVPEERVAAEAEALKGVVAAAGGAAIAEEAPRNEQLAYTMRKKTVSGSYDKYDSAYFGWVKFELASDKIEGVKKAIEAMPSVLRILVITTIRENTYLGKRVSVAAAFGGKAPASPSAEMAVAGAAVGAAVGAAIAPETAGPGAEAPAKPAAAPVSIEQMDKSIDEMVKEA